MQITQTLWGHVERRRRHSKQHGPRDAHPFETPWFRLHSISRLQGVGQAGLAPLNLRYIYIYIYIYMMMMMITALAAFASHRGAFDPCTPTPELILARRKAWAPSHYCGSPFLTPCKKFSRELGGYPIQSCGDPWGPIVANRPPPRILSERSRVEPSCHSLFD